MIDQVFQRLDQWRRLPAYQLERRADIFFAAYLPAFLTARYHSPVTALIPEFPVANLDTNHSKKVDYLVQLRDISTVVFLELKTDQASRRDTQDSYLSDAQRIGMEAVLAGVVRVASNPKTRSKLKYGHLFDELLDAGFIVQTATGTWEPSATPWTSEVLYLQPRAGIDGNVIDFRTFADFVRRNDDPLSKRFADSLDEWASVEAGARPLRAAPLV